MKKRIFAMTICMMILATVTIFATDLGELQKVLPTDAETVVFESNDSDIFESNGSSYISVKDTYKAAQSLYQYEHDAVANKLVLISDDVVVDADGKAKINKPTRTTVLSDRAITENLAKPNAPEPVKPNTSAGSTGDNSVEQLAVAGGIIILAAGAIFIIRAW